MHGSFETEKTSFQHASQRDGGDGCSDDGMTKRNHRRIDNSKPRRKGKSNFTSARKLKESQLVWS